MTHKKTNTKPEEALYELLDECLESRPSTEAIKALANSSPLAWARAVYIFAQLAGYQSRLETEIKDNYTISLIRNMDYNSLVQLVGKLQRELEPSTVPGELGHSENRGKQPSLG